MHPSPYSRLLRDSHGGMMLLGVFTAVFLCAAVFHVAGIGQAIAHRERMQDAADAAALAGAVVHARGMNILVLINIVMAALVAMLVALKLTETLATVGIVIATAIAFYAPPVAKVIPSLVSVATNARKGYDKVDGPVHRGLRVLNATAHAVQRTVPVLSQARVLDVVGQFDPPAHAGVVIPGRWSLPTRDGNYAMLCGKAGEFTGALAILPFAGLGIGDLLSGPLSELTASNADWFCGGKGTKRPSTTVTVETAHPELPARARCRKAAEQLGDGTARRSNRMQARCDEALDEEKRSQPHPDTGECQQDCGNDGAYTMRAILARSECRAPTLWHARRLSGFQWQERRVLRTYRRAGRRYRLVSSEIIDGPFLKTGDKPPCGHRGTIDSTWHTDAGDQEKLGETWPVPLCEAIDAGNADQMSRSVTEVVHVFGCTTTHRETHTVSKADGGQQDSAEVPQALLADARMGDENFQLRGIVIGSEPGGLIDGAMAAATWGQQPTRAPAAAGRFAVAQAEFYFDGDSAPELTLWQMRWRARLRRFRLARDTQDSGPDGGGANDLADGCSTIGDAIAPGICNALRDDLPLGDLLVAH